MTISQNYKHVCAKENTHQALKMYAAVHKLRSMDETLKRLLENDTDRS